MKKRENFLTGYKYTLLRKILKIMKLTTILLLATNMLVSASLYSQSTRLSLKFKEISYEEFFREIEKKTEFRFAFSSSKLDPSQKIGINVKNETLDKILDKALPGEISYEIIDKYVVIINANEKEQSTVIQQQKSISGTVTDESGLPLPGTTVLIKGTTQGTVTNADGKFSLTDLPEKATLVFSFVGMRTQEITPGSQTVINITMKVDAIGIEEVVAIGYGTIRKSDLTGSVVKVDVEKLEELSNVNVTEALHGNVAGLNVGATDLTGQDPEISVRGNNTLGKSEGGGSPLIVLDGAIYRGKLIEINPNDIASVDILKDASSAAIYGSEASNGVMVITTKQGGIGKGGKPVVSYRGSYTYSTPSNVKTPMKRDEYLEKFKDATWRDSRQAPDYISSVPGYDMYSAGFVGNEAGVFGYQEGLDYDWWGNFTSNGHRLEQNISVRGGGENSNYFISGGLTENEGYLKNDEYKRYSYRINIDTDITDWLKIGINSFLSSNDYSGNIYSVSGIFSQFTPITSPVDENGDYFLDPGLHNNINPYLYLEMEDEETRLNLFANTYAEIDLPFVQGLKYKIAYNQNYTNYKHNHFNELDNNYLGEGYKNTSYDYIWSLDNIISYNRKFNNLHSVYATLVYGNEKRMITSTNARAQNFSNPTLGYDRLQAGDPLLNVINSNREEETSIYSMARLVYKYNERYIFTGSVRRDGFSGFGLNRKIGYFPSLALAWVASEESFFNIDWFNYLKIRGSYGITGRRAAGRYDTKARVNSGVVYSFGGESVMSQWISSLANNDLGWEKTTGLNAGFDFALFNSTIHGNIEYYNNDTRDILYPIKLPTMSGFSSINTNIGQVHNHGLEFSLHANIIKSRDLTWTSSVNFSRNRNEIISILGYDDDGDGVEDDLVENRLFIGEPQSVNYDYTIQGIWQLEDETNGTIDEGFSAGTYKIKDINGDDDFSPQDMEIQSYQDPGYRMGIGNTLNYKGFEFYMFINTIQGGKNYYWGNDDPNASHQWKGHEGYPRTWNLPAGGWDYWTPANPDAKYRTIARAATKVPNPIHYTQRNFVRLQDLSLAYNFKSDLTKKIGFRNIKVYCSAKNLLTLTKWQGMDPEVGRLFSAANMIPLMRSYSFGLNFEL